MESTLILMELTKIRMLLTVFVILSVAAVVVSLVVLVAYAARRFDIFLDKVDREIEQDGG